MTDTRDDPRPPTDGGDLTGMAGELERRIVRRLDGELDPAHGDELTRHLLRDPEAHRLMDQYAAADAAAGDALRIAFGPQEADGRGQWEGLRDREASEARRRWAGAAAAAAVLLTIAVGYVARQLAPPSAAAPRGLAARGADPGTAPEAQALPAGLERWIWQVWQPPAGEAFGARPAEAIGPQRGEASGVVPVPLPAIQGPRQRRRAVERHLFSVPDETGNTIYLLGVDRVRTRVRAVETDL